MLPKEVIDFLIKHDIIFQRANCFAFEINTEECLERTTYYYHNSDPHHWYLLELNIFNIHGNHKKMSEARWEAEKSIFRSRTPFGNETGQLPIGEYR